MRLLYYSNTREKKIHGNSDLYIDSLRKKIQGKLRMMEAKSEIQNDTISFKRIVRNTTDSGMNKIEAWKIVREGFIRIKKLDSSRIEIAWEVKLDILLFLSILIGFLIGLVVGFAGSILVFAILTGILFSTIVYLIGCSVIKAKIDEIVETSM